LPRATRTRTARERSQLGGRTQEIQRLIGRSIRAMLDDYTFGEYTVRLDCDVLQADGGTRTAAISGACVATVQAFEWMVETGRLRTSPVRRRVAAVSVGLLDGEPRLDLDYPEDVAADVDMNVVMSSEGRFVEVQGTGEHGTFPRDELDLLLDLASRGIREIDAAQRRVLGQ
jgi:ribonuclease PH